MGSVYDALTFPLHGDVIGHGCACPSYSCCGVSQSSYSYIERVPKRAELSEGGGVRYAKLSYCAWWWYEHVCLSRFWCMSQLVLCYIRFRNTPSQINAPHSFRDGGIALLPTQPSENLKKKKPSTSIKLYIRGALPIATRRTTQYYFNT